MERKEIKQKVNKVIDALKELEEIDFCYEYICEIRNAKEGMKRISLFLED